MKALEHKKEVQLEVFLLMLSAISPYEFKAESCKLQFDEARRLEFSLTLNENASGCRVDSICTTGSDGA